MLSALNPAYFRPISLLPVMTKLVGKAVQAHMLSFMERTKQFNFIHHTYRALHSTTALLQLSDAIYEATYENLITSTMTIDESATFDSMDHDLISDKLNMYNVSTSALYIVFISHDQQLMRLTAPRLSLLYNCSE